MSEVLNSFIDNFVLKDKRERYKSLLSSKKRRKDGIWDLLHDGRHLDKQRFQLYLIKEADDVLKKLQKLSVQNSVYVLVNNEDGDGRDMSIHAVLEDYFGKQVDVLAYDHVVKAGYYENHEGEIYVFSKDD